MTFFLPIAMHTSEIFCSVVHVCQHDVLVWPVPYTSLSLLRSVRIVDFPNSLCSVDFVHTL